MPIDHANSHTRRQRKKSSPKPEANRGTPSGYNREQEPPVKAINNKRERQTDLPIEERKTESIELPDAFCRYLMLKHAETWQKFTEFAKTKKTFATGLARLLEILRTGDEQDKKIFSLFPLDVLNEFDLEIELEGVKEEYSKNGELILGGPRWNWRKVINEVNWEKDPNVVGIIKFDDIDKMPDGKAKEDALENKRHIENNPLVRKALQIFGGKIIGLKEQTKDGDEE